MARLLTCLTDTNTIMFFGFILTEAWSLDIRTLAHERTHRIQWIFTGLKSVAFCVITVAVLGLLGCAGWWMLSLLTVKVPDKELRQADIGTLIFHPSPLPYGRGASSLKWAYRRGEPITAATWFWADSGYDTGDICEQEIVKIDHTVRPRTFYEREILPAMLRTLERCLDNLQKGIIRRIPQVERYATYDGRI